MARYCCVGNPRAQAQRRERTSVRPYSEVRETRSCFITSDVRVFLQSILWGSSGAKPEGMHTGGGVNMQPGAMRTCKL